MEWGKVRAFVRISGTWMKKPPHLSPLPLPRGKGGVAASFSKLIINKQYRLRQRNFGHEVYCWA
jgi:hypothetical protein